MDKRIWTPASPPPAPRSSHRRSSPSGSSPFRQLQGNGRSPGKARPVPGSSGTMVAVKRRPDTGPSPRRPPSRPSGAENTPRPERVEVDREAEKEEEEEEEEEEVVDEDGEAGGMGEASMVVSHSQPDGMQIVQDGNGLRPMDVVEIHDSESEEGTVAEDEAVGEDSEDEDDDDEQGEDATVPVHIEVRLRPQSTIMFDTIKRTVGQYIHQDLSCMQTNEEVPGWEDIAILCQHVDSVRCTESEKDVTMVTVAQSRLHIHVYQTHAEDVLTTFTAGTQSDDATGDVDGIAGGGGAEDQGDVAASVLELPAVGLEGVWDSLVYEGDVKSNLLNYIYSTIRFSEHDVDHALISWHRLVLLHGPPGTGKTSLCRGLAQKLAIRLSAVYDHAKLVEINSHSLFSKWFSESGKLVQRLFQQVTEMVEDESTFVVVLIDEVESLTSARAGAMTGNEPSDALRVVNALLTQLDKLKQRKNVLVLTTSNLSAAIDPAFVDRADIKQYIGLPPVQAVYWVLRSCLLELMRNNLIRERTLLDYREALAFCPLDAPKSSQDDLAPETKSARRQRMVREASSKLLSLASKCHDQGMSGRSLRRLPLLADAKCGSARWSGKPVGVATFLDAMESAIEIQRAAMDKMGENSC